MSVLVDVRRGESGAATVTIERAEKRNALSSEVMEALISAFNALSAWQGLRAVVLTGAGQAAFIGGADVHEMARLDAHSARSFIARVHRCCRAVIECPVPVVARIDGFALGAGLEIAAACDLRIASEVSRFGMPEVRLGMPSVVEAALLPRLVGVGRARWLVYTGELIDGKRALQWGLVEELVPRDELDVAVARTVSALLAGGPLAMRAQKALCVAWDERPPEEAIASSIDVFAGMWQTQEPRARLREYLRTRNRARKRD